MQFERLPAERRDSDSSRHHGEQRAEPDRRPGTDRALDRSTGDDGAAPLPSAPPPAPPAPTVSTTTELTDDYLAAGQCVSVVSEAVSDIHPATYGPVPCESLTAVAQVVSRTRTALPARPYPP